MIKCGGKYYVYIHMRGTDGRIFYVGKGAGKRAYSKSGRNRHWHRIVSKYGYTCEIVDNFDNEDEAFLLERWLIAKYRHQGVDICNISDGGEGPSGIHLTEERKKALSHMNSGRKSYRYDHTIRRFVNIDGRSFTGTRHDFEIKFNLRSTSITNLISGRIGSTLGWVLEFTDDDSFTKVGAKKQYKYSNKLYLFSKNGKSIICNRHIFSNIICTTVGKVCSVITGKHKSIKGWSVSEL